jgi:sterol desaturase/sphingolipid hydroxylase (fatty acid hydroxylase superfamily)
MSSQTYLVNVAVILAVMAAVAVVEAAVPFFARPAAPSRRRRANLAMTLQTLLFAFVLTAAVTAAAAALPLASPGLMAVTGVPPVAQFVLGIVALDCAYGYLAHRTMHAWPRLWSFHRVHHSDPFVDVTTSFRTHPVEIAWRHLWLFAAVWLLGVPAAAVAAFRSLSAVNGILEHANIRVPPTLDTALSWLWVTPRMHKIHHSRDAAETDTNYGNLLTMHDRVFGTFVPTRRASSVTYGLDEVAAAEHLSFAALLALPWRSRSALDREAGRPVYSPTAEHRRVSAHGVEVRR